MKPPNLIVCFNDCAKSSSVVIIRIFFIIHGLMLCKANAQNTVVVNSDINFEPIPTISLTDYKSVQLRDQSKQNPKLAFGVSISGGGSRAEYFGLGVLLGLEQVKDPNQESQRNLLDEVDYFSSVSGGSLAAGYYLTIKKNLLLLNKYKSFNEFWLSDRHVDDLQEFIWQSADVKDFIFSFEKYEHNSNKIVSMPEVIDSQLLQYNLSENSRKFKERMRLSDFFIPIASLKNPTLPLFVANGTIFTSVERLPFMPHILKALDVNRSLMPVDESFEQDPSYSFPLTYAVSGSAAFPGILPQVKLGLSSSDKVIRVVDGGVVDNLGYKTLIELLASDHDVDIKNKRAVMIDCSAIGEGSRYGNPDAESRINVLKSALLFTVDSKYVTRNADIKSYLSVHGIDTGNYCLLGFNTIKNNLKVPEIANDSEFIKLRDSLRQDVGKTESEKDSNNRWLRLFQKFQNSVIKHCGLKAPAGAVIDDVTWDDNKLRTIDFITFKDFESFKPVDKLMLYELASQVETKMKIFKSEKIILILAGKYAVFLEQRKLQQLYTINTN